MARPQWGDFGSIWKTIREVDVNAIRHEAERDVAIVCVGQPPALRHADRLLRDGPNRYPLSHDPLALVPLDEAGRYLEYVRTADLVIVALDDAPQMSAEELEGLRQLVTTQRPHQVALLFHEALGDAIASPGGVVPAPGLARASGVSPAWTASLDARAVRRVDLAAPEAAAQVAGAVMDALPAGARLAAARRLPGLRPLFSARLTGEVSVSNATVALASGVPSMVPLLGIPLSAADTIILTKNEALMVYRLALACGAPPEFQRRMVDIAPVIGGAVVWRQIAGALVGLVPGYGLVPKTAVAFGGTYVVGLLATHWYETGLLSNEDRKRIVAEAAALAHVTATTMVAQARAAGDKAGAQTRTGIKKVSAGVAAAGTRARSTARGATQATKARTRSGVRRVLRRKDAAKAGPNVLDDATSGVAGASTQPPGAGSRPVD